MQRLAVIIFFSVSIWAADGGVDPSAIPRLLPLSEPAAPEKYARPDCLVSTSDLAAWLDDTSKKTVVLDGRSGTAFQAGHIPGARNIQSDQFQDPNLPPYFLPPVEAVKMIAAQEGISAQTRVVVYDEDDGRLAARIWFTFHAYGHDHIAILNGGVAQWKSEHRGWTSAQPVVDGTGTFIPLGIPRNICSLDELAHYRVRTLTLGRMPTATLLDARSRAEYMGDDARGKTAGHIPGATNIPWNALMSGNEGSRIWRTAPEMHGILRVANVDKSSPIAVYDQAGGRSAHLYFSLWLMGFEQIKNYVGGWREYGNRLDVEVEK